MKSILRSIQPKSLVKILNGEATIIISKTAPKEWLDYLRGKGPKPEALEVFLYCTKGGASLLRTDPLFSDDDLDEDEKRYMLAREKAKTFYGWDDVDCVLNGKVVAKFILKETTEYINGCNVTKDSGYMFGDAEREGVYEKACFSEEDIERYFPDESFKAWHISDLVIFDEPKELDEFDYLNPSGIVYVSQRSLNGLANKKYPPRSWFYVEEKE